ncbi:DUF1125 domain-containing protein [Lactococcus lactis]|nr:DUF1125 domain-containing protein [Lactococcus lactis]MCM6849951.1 DUF1125 domain-containing protein [Lactococcus lactis]MCM6852373.1 DUF1125 domain-containing protein [Lactococcus lactis]MCM6857711.1 DUF1125 domain-containing protein [Lactococcus lactis]
MKNGRELIAILEDTKND